MTIGSTRPGEASLARQLARASLAVDLGRFDAEVIAKAKICLLDFLSCAFEARDHPWSRQAIGIARAVEGGATVIGTSKLATPGEAAFANATLGHGLVREDMHAASICHHGVVIWPTLLALSERTETIRCNVSDRRDRRLRGRRANWRRAFYHRSGAALPSNRIGGSARRRARRAAHALDLTEDAATSAVAIAANTSSGLNEWPRAGGSEMYFHPGFAARNAIAAIELAEAGCRCLRNDPRRRGRTVRCLFPTARTLRHPIVCGPSAGNHGRLQQAGPCLQLRANLRASSIAGRAPTRKLRGHRDRFDTRPRGSGPLSRLRFRGPFRNALQAKMSIPFSVAAVLARGALEEDNYAKVDDPETLRLVDRTELRSEPGFTAAFPANQGAEVLVGLRNGTTVHRRLDNVIAATPEEIRTRFRQAAGNRDRRRRRKTPGTVYRRLRIARGLRRDRGSLSARFDGRCNRQDRRRRTEMGGAMIRSSNTQRYPVAARDHW